MRLQNAKIIKIRDKKKVEAVQKIQVLPLNLIQYDIKNGRLLKLGD